MGKKLNLLIIGEGGHGKDEVATYFQNNFGTTSSSSSNFAAIKFIYDLLKDKYGYQSFDECYEDRRNKRVEWYELICEYNKENRSRLAKEILDKYDIYVGMRDLEEYESCMENNLFDYVFWVDATKRLGKGESSDSNKLSKKHAHFIIDNNDTLEDLHERLYHLGQTLFV